MTVTIDEKTTPGDIGRIFSENNIDKVIFANLNGEIVCSDPRADFLIPVIKGLNEWRNHEAVLMKADDLTRCLYIVSVHSTVRGRPEGGVRLKNYSTFFEGLNDCLALSFGMTEKNAYAGYWEGGAKSVIIPFDDRIFKALMDGQAKEENENHGAFREMLWKHYGGFTAKMQGLYLAGEDMNLNSWDMRSILRYNVHSSCLSESVGGAGNPSPKTAKGIFKAIQATCEVEFPESPEITNKRIILKGAGLVGKPLGELLVNAGAKVIIYDTDPDAEKKLGKLATDVEELEIIAKKEGEHEDAFNVRLRHEELKFLRAKEADIFSPNAKSGTLTSELIEALRVKAIVGAENAQIAKKEEKEITNRLHALGIVYVPEPAINTMGVFSAYQEHSGIVIADFEIEAEKIYGKTKDLLSEARENNRKPYDLFIEIAKREAVKPHPIFGHRGIRIIAELVESWRPNRDNQLAVGR